MANIQFQDYQVRMTNDGSTDPAASTTGRLQNPGDDIEIWGLDNYENIKLIREGSSDGLAVATLWGQGA
jgi:hypothetical protein